MKFREYVEGVNRMLEEHPEFGEMEMEQEERWADEEACLPQHFDEDTYHRNDVIYL